jgi:FKBP-type peptidyl-prolyl cis-trans isomerase
MRHAKILAAVAASVLSVTMLAACSSSGSSSTTSSTTSTTSGGGTVGASGDVTVTGEYGKAPSVSIPSKTPGSALAVKTLVQGSGPAVSSSAAFVANYVFYTWDGGSHKLLANTWTSSPQLMDGTLLPGLTTALDGKKVGSRILAVVPPSQAYGAQGDTQEGITGSDTLVFVVDLLGVFGNKESVPGTQAPSGAGLPTVSDTSGAAPTITIPASAPPATEVAKTLIEGDGPQVKSGQYIVVQYTGVNWRTGKVFDSSWSRSQPFGLQLGQVGGVIVGWDIGLAGQRVGSRVLLVIPPKDGYGSKGESAAGIEGTDTIVFVVDILGVFG